MPTVKLTRQSKLLLALVAFFLSPYAIFFLLLPLGTSVAGGFSMVGALVPIGVYASDAAENIKLNAHARQQWCLAFFFLSVFSLPMYYSQERANRDE